MAMEDWRLMELDIPVGDVCSLQNTWWDDVRENIKSFDFS